MLASTKALLNSFLHKQSPSGVDANAPLFTDDSPPFLELQAGILRFSKDKDGIRSGIAASLDDSALVCLSTADLKRLAVTSGSLVCSVLDFNRTL